MDPISPPNPAEAVADCPEDAWLRLLLRDGAEASTTEALARHLETCAKCRLRLDTLASLEQVVPATAGRTTAAPTPTSQESNVLRAMMERLRSREFEVASDVAAPAWNLEILSPPVRPGALGRFDSYDILERIASGGMGVVFKAHDPMLNRVVAIKVLAPVLATSESARARFLREARAAAAVVHEHVVAIHAVGEHRGLPYLVMQFIAGTSLEARLQRGRLTLEEILRIGAQTAQGLAAAHAQGLIHRDVKPGNILLENGVERVKLTDFGLARAADEPGVTRAGVVAGTPEFMSPEQARGERVDPRSDLFSLGCVLYMMAAGNSAFAADSTPATLRRVCDFEPPRVEQVNSRMPEWLGDLIQRLMAKQPEHRLAGATEIAHLLEESLKRLQAAGGEVTEFPRILPLQAGRFSRRKWIQAGVLGALVAVVGGIWFGWVRSPRPAVSGRETTNGVFRLLNAGVPSRNFANLAEAILRSEKGSIIELSFDGPLDLDPISFTGRDLVLRAAPGTHPILVNRVANESFLRCDGSLTLEGLEIRSRNANSDSITLADPGPWLQRLAADKLRERSVTGDGVPALVQVRDGDFTARNCRFVTPLEKDNLIDGLAIMGARRADLIGCEFYTVGGIAVRCRAGRQRAGGRSEAPAVLTVSNSLFLSGRPLAVASIGAECQVTIERNTFVSGVLFTLNPRGLPTVTANQNIFAVRGLTDMRLGPSVLTTNRWKGRQNLISTPKGFAAPHEWAAGKLGPQSRIVQLSFHARLQSQVSQARKMTPKDFQITEADVTGAPGSTLEYLRQHGCQAETVGPGAPYHAVRR